MTASRCLGLIGGLGVGATTFYYEKLVKALESAGRTPEIVIVHAETARVFEYVQAGDRDGLAEYLNRYIRRLQAAGADLVAIPAVTPHFCIHELTAISSLPLLSIFEPLRQEITERRLLRVAVFGTRFVMESSLFGALAGVEVIRARPAEVEIIHKTYVELASTGKGSAEQRRILTAIAQTLIARDQAEAVLLAGTDLALLFEESNAGFPCMDCAALHIRSIADEMIQVAPPSERKEIADGG